MTPDFDEIVGSETPAAEAESLRRVHELLLSADPPPLDTVEPAPVLKSRAFMPRSTALLAAAVSAAAAVIAGIAIGYSVRGSGFETGFTRPMHGVGAASGASAVIRVGKQDAAGNRTLEMSVRRLPALPGGAWYELYLTKKGKPVVPCGTFQTGRLGSAQVTMNAPTDLAEYDGWIVTAELPGKAGDHVLLTT
jgi:hypothetical protein